MSKEWIFKGKEVDSKLVGLIITDQLFYDVPILFIGTNNERVRIIGSHVEDLEDRIVQFVIPLNDKMHEEFVSGNITYRELLEQADAIYLHHIIDSEDDRTYKIKYKDIPDEYLPSIDSYCPEEMKKKK